MSIFADVMTISGIFSLTHEDVQKTVLSGHCSNLEQSQTGIVAEMLEVWICVDADQRCAIVMARSVMTQMR